MPPRRRSVGETLAEQHRKEGRNALVTEIFEALANWEKHREQCYCGACEVLKPAFREWTRIGRGPGLDVPDPVPRGTETPAPPKRRRTIEFVLAPAHHAIRSPFSPDTRPLTRSSLDGIRALIAGAALLTQDRTPTQPRRCITTGGLAGTARSRRRRSYRNGRTFGQ